jgi:hypothetical protein
VNDSRSLQLRRIGWLLTPLVVWAASFLGAWGGAAIADRSGRMSRGLGMMAGGAVVTAAVAVTIWLLVIRRGARSERAAPPGDPPTGSPG